MLTWQKIISEKENDLWKLFHLNAKISEGQKPLRKTIRDFCLNHHPINLPKTKDKKINVSLEKAIRERRSSRTMKNLPISLETLSSLLYNSYSSRKSTPQPQKTAPSAGALFPIEIYFHCSTTKKNTSNFTPGLYYYCPMTLTITKYSSNLRQVIADNIFIQKKLAENSTLQFFLVANFSKITEKYGDLGYRFCLLEAGHIAQNFNLVAQALGLSCVNIGGYSENNANQLLALDGLTSSVIYMIAMGF
jgi:SagB-type dehydrogenase family enzyme